MTSAFASGSGGMITFRTGAGAGMGSWPGNGGNTSALFLSPGSLQNMQKPQGIDIDMTAIATGV